MDGIIYSSILVALGQLTNQICTELHKKQLYYEWVWQICHVHLLT